ncbi:myrosinase 1-like isoform X1 [Zophobas morio]|uniref:myrosinase 1-like isoform X1 n=1 Tax=Zophobas morio TaxID=2755281 RepID=UPI003082F1E5
MASLEIYYTFIVCLFCFSQTTLAVDNRKFPAGFKFGVATASYQIEGGWDEDGKGENIWDHLTHVSPDLINHQSNGDISCDSYHKYKTDVALLKELGVDFYRFSLSWSRILPTGYIDGGINEPGVAYYENILDLLEENGIEPMITLYHWDLPQPLHENVGGWLNETIVDIFANYARLAFDLFGDRVKYWVTFNEPLSICQQGYETGGKAPAISDNPGVDLYICGHMVLKSHAAAYHIYDKEYKPKQKGKISIVINTNWEEPGSDDAKDVEAAERTLQFRFGWFANPIVHGNYPQVMIDRIGNRSVQEGFTQSRLPQFTDEEVESIKGTYDYIGLNHYSTSLIKWREDIEIGEPSSSKDMSVQESIDFSWETSASYWLFVVPWGMRKISKWVKDTYNNPEIIITENGYSDAGGILNDDRRINYIREYLSSLLEAIYDDEVNVTGYTAWSLMDNFEWFRGYAEKFGLYSVNFTDPERPRTPKTSVDYYKSILTTRCLVEECTE